MWPFLEHEGILAFAHRGGAGDWPENTLAAFEHAIALGYRYVETDVHTTSDGVLVAFHDDHLDRVTDRNGAIAELPWTEVRRAVVLPPPSSDTSGAPIPLLEDILGAWPGVRVNIDPKHDRAVGPLTAVLERTQAYDRVCIAAFSDRRLGELRRLTSDRVCTALGPRGITRLRLASLGIPAGSIPGACAQVPVRLHGLTIVDARFVAAAHRRGLPVHVWTIDEREEMVRLLDLGVDGIMTDRPTLLKEVLTERGQWPGGSR